MPDTAPAYSVAETRKAGTTHSRVKLWQSDPRVFAREVCKVEPDRWQDNFLAALGGPHLDPLAKPKLALKACKGPGKSFILGVAGWWWISMRKHAQGAVMSITGDNLRDTLWKEFALIQNRSAFLQHFFAIRGEKIEAKEHSRTWFLSARSFPQNADKNQQANTIAGLHGKHPIVICDEVGDFPDGVVVAAEAIFANNVDARLIIAGNPTNTEGPLYRVTTRDQGKWWGLSITGDPNDRDRAPRISREWAQEQIDTWGYDHDFVKINVRGMFPSQQGNKLISPEEAMTASSREPDPALYRQQPKVMGLDIARLGNNESVLAKRQGVATMYMQAWRQIDSMTLADQVYQEYQAYRPWAFFADSTGIGGPVIDRLRQLGVPVTAIDFGSAAMDAKRYFDRRSEMYSRMAEWLKRGGCIPNDLQLRADLVAPNFSYVATGRQTKFKLESKGDMHKRGLASPDRGDALALTFAMDVVAPPMLEQDATLQGALSYTGKFIGGTREGEWDPLG